MAGAAGASTRRTSKTDLRRLRCRLPWNNWLRFDVTGEYRAKCQFKALGSYTEFCPGGRCFDLYDGNHSAWVFLANAYIDLGTWWCVTPFIGAGVGGAYHHVERLHRCRLHLRTAPPASAMRQQTDATRKWNFAWALHAGLAYNVTSNFKVELAYRYLNWATSQTAHHRLRGAPAAAGAGPRAYYTLTNFTSHDLKIGVRWMLQPEPAPAPVYAAAADAQGLSDLHRRLGTAREYPAPFSFFGGERSS